jgi:DNA sulfur modification protein DndC
VQLRIRPGKMKLEMPRVWPMLAPMGASSYSDIRDSLRNLYLEDPRPWVVGFSGGKDSTMLASLIVEVVAGIPRWALRRRWHVRGCCLRARSGGDAGRVAA